MVQFVSCEVTCSNLILSTSRLVSRVWTDGASESVASTESAPPLPSMVIIEPTKDVVPVDWGMNKFGIATASASESPTITKRLALKTLAAFVGNVNVPPTPGSAFFQSVAMVTDRCRR